MNRGGYSYVRNNTVRRGREMETVEEMIKRDPRIKKYHAQRHRLFHRFDDGIQLDYEGWFSVTPEDIAKHIAERFRGLDVVADLFAGPGGNCIQFAKMGASKVVCVDISQDQLDMLRNNAEIYGVEQNMEYVCGNTYEIGSELAKRGDIEGIFMSPPWGGPSYSNQDVFDVSCFKAAVEVAKSITPNVCVLVPRNVDDEQVHEVFGECEIEGNYTGKKLKTKSLYFGGLMFNNQRLGSSKRMYRTQHNTSIVQPGGSYPTQLSFSGRLKNESWHNNSTKSRKFETHRIQHQNPDSIRLGCNQNSIPNSPTQHHHYGHTEYSGSKKCQAFSSLQVQASSGRVSLQQQECLHRLQDNFPDNDTNLNLPEEYNDRATSLRSNVEHDCSTTGGIFNEDFNRVRYKLSGQQIHDRVMDWLNNSVTVHEQKMKNINQSQSNRGTHYYSRKAHISNNDPMNRQTENGGANLHKGCRVKQSVSTATTYRERDICSDNRRQESSWNRPPINRAPYDMNRQGYNCGSSRAPQRNRSRIDSQTWRRGSPIY